MTSLTLIAIRRAKREKRTYDLFAVILMICTLGTLVFPNPKYSIVCLLLTTLALISSNATQTNIQLLENEITEETLSKYVDDNE